jgi:hypothetical protein
MFDPRHVPADLPGGAAEAVAFLERCYRRWHDGIAGLDEEGLARPLGPTGGPYAEDPMAELIAHINGEVMPHGAEIALLRDLYRATGATTRDSRLVPVPGRALSGRPVAQEHDAGAERPGLGQPQPRDRARSVSWNPSAGSTVVGSHSGSPMAPETTYFATRLR